jgi:hypothetical protein
MDAGLKIPGDLIRKQSCVDYLYDLFPIHDHTAKIRIKLLRHVQSGLSENPIPAILFTFIQPTTPELPVSS